ncbi:hypothetical protein EIQ10_22850 [Xanthomonas campestris pv. campestris]
MKHRCSTLAHQANHVGARLRAMRRYREGFIARERAPTKSRLCRSRCASRARVFAASITQARTMQRSIAP